MSRSILVQISRLNQREITGILWRSQDIQAIQVIPAHQERAAGLVLPEDIQSSINSIPGPGLLPAMARSRMIMRLRPALRMFISQSQIGILSQLVRSWLL